MVAGAAAVTAAASLAELVGDAGHDWNVRFLEELARGHVGLRALLAHDAYQALRQDRRERRHEPMRVHSHVRETTDDVEDVVGVHGGEHQAPDDHPKYLERLVRLES